MRTKHEKYEIKGFLAKQLRPFWRFCLEKRWTVCLLASAALALTALQIASSRPAEKVCVKDETGRLIELRLGEGGSSVSVPLTAEAQRDGETVRAEVLLTLRQTDQNGQMEDGEASGETAGTEKELARELAAVLADLSDGEAEIALPAQLADGTLISWSQDRELGSYLAVLLILPLGMIFLYRDRQQKERTARKRQADQIRKGLPGFHDQLLLLLSSGLIFHDAFGRIAEGCRRRQEQDALQRLIVEAETACQETGSSLVTVLAESARAVGVREFSRMVRIISENQSKGVDLREKLESESEILWNQRKKLAEERGKAAETKLSFPLAILLVVLIVITASPAILDM